MDHNKLINDLYSDIDLLRQGSIYELVKGPGKPKCATLANRIEERLDILIKGFEKDLQKKEITDRDNFEMHADLLSAISKEISELSKKQPDALVNAFKVEQLNRILISLKEIFKEEPTIGFLDLVAEPAEETKGQKSRHTYSDVAVILSQFREACVKYRNRHYPVSDDWPIKWGE